MFLLSYQIHNRIMLPPINKTPFHLSGQKKHMDNLLNPLPTVLFLCRRMFLAQISICIAHHQRMKFKIIFSKQLMYYISVTVWIGKNTYFTSIISYIYQHFICSCFFNQIWKWICISVFNDIQKSMNRKNIVLHWYGIIILSVSLLYIFMFNQFILTYGLFCKWKKFITFFSQFYFLICSLENPYSYFFFKITDCCW